jgi:hypothetical protein
MNEESNRLKHLDNMREMTRHLNKIEKRRGVLLLMPGVDPDIANFPRISAERHARIPTFQYFLNYIRGIRGDDDPNNPYRRGF